MEVNRNERSTRLLIFIFGKEKKKRLHFSLAITSKKQRDDFLRQQL
jgi:hypothetical protein